MKWIGFGLVFAVLTPFIGAQNTPAVKQAESACGPFTMNFNVKTISNPAQLAPVQPGKAQIYIIEVYENPAYKIGAGPTIRIGMDGSWVGADHHDSYLVLPVDAGEHHLCMNWQSRIKTLSRLISLENFTAVPGRIYYFQARITSHKFVGPWYTLDLEPVNNDEAKLLLAQRAQGTSTVKK